MLRLLSRAKRILSKEKVVQVLGVGEMPPGQNELLLNLSDFCHKHFV